MKEFLSGLPCASITPIEVGSELLDDTVISSIEAETDKVKVSQSCLFVSLADDTESGTSVAVTLLSDMVLCHSSVTWFSDIGYSDLAQRHGLLTQLNDTAQ